MQGGNSAFEGFGSRPAVVVTLHSGDLLRRASGSAASLGGDLIEVRLDALAPQSEALAEHLPEIAKSIPLILTARYPSEGGEGKLTWKTRRSLIDRFVEFAFAVDIEARSLDAAGGWLEELRSAGMKLVVSHHDFEGLPENGRIEEAVARAAESGADVAKLAYRLENPQHLSRLLRVFCAEKRLPLAAMGMGPMGRLSRLVFARCGSVLNYAHAGEANAPGQWEASRFRGLLGEL